jgi:hypothetical protein
MHEKKGGELYKVVEHNNIIGRKREGGGRERGEREWVRD